MDIRVVYVRGISKKAVIQDVQSHFSGCGNILNIDFDESKPRGFLWIEFEDHIGAQCAVRDLHHSFLLGCALSVRLEESNLFPPKPKSAVAAGTSDRLVVSDSKSEHSLTTAAINTNIIDTITPRTVTEINHKVGGKRKSDSRDPYVSFTSSAVQINQKVYPIPSGKYLMKLIRMSHSTSIRSHSADLLPLLDLLCEKRFGNK